MKALRGAIIGLGNVAVAVHLPGWRRRHGVEIVAVSDVDPTRRLAGEAELPGARWYGSAEALIADEALDFVDICTPPSSHAPLIRSALLRGLHVLCEKPLVRSVEELAAVTRLAAASARVLHTVHNWHYAPIVERTSELIAQGAIGRVTHVIWQTLRTRPAPVADERGANWRVDPAVAGGGVLIDHGWHVFYILQRWMGEPPTAVSARLETRRHASWEVEDTATVRVIFSQAQADVLLTWASDERGNSAEVRGTEGTIALHDDALVLTQGAQERRFSCPPALSNGSVHPDWFDPVTDRFLADVTGQLPRNSNLAEASLCVVLTSLARESSRCAGQVLPVPIAVAPSAGPASSSRA